MSTKVKEFSMRQAFAETLVNLAAKNPNLYAVSADLKSSLGLTTFASRFRSRFIEVGVAENNAAAIAGGLAKTGKTVFLCSFSCFSPALNWAVIKQSILYQDLPVKIVGSHSGLMSGELGATHQMLEDIALTNTLPGLEVFAPLDALEAQKITKVIAHSSKASYLRLVRPSTQNFTSAKNSFTIGKSHLLKSGKHLTIVGYGPVLAQALEAQNILNQDYGKKAPQLEIINLSSIKPFDSATILKSVKKTNHLIVIEDHQQNGGLGQILSSHLLQKGLSPSFTHLAVDDSFGLSSFDYRQLWQHYGIGLDSLLKSIKSQLSLK